MSDPSSFLNLSGGGSAREQNCVSCKKAIPAETTFCPFCRSEQSAGAPISKPDSFPSEPESKTDDRSSNYNFQNLTRGVVDAVGNSQNPFLEFRASDNIWNIEEREPIVKPEQRRPALIVDEETILFAHTAKHLSPEQLLDRVQSIINAQNVPVEATLTMARWISDNYEIRPRIVASLKDHAFSGLKMILGLDYMGSWASLQYQIGLQPDPYPKPPPSVGTANTLPVVLVVCSAFVGFIGLLATAAGSSSGSAGAAGFGVFCIIAGVAGVIAGIAWYAQMQQQIDTQQVERDRYLREQYEIRSYKARMQLSRTFKIDDMKLFQTAMRVVFQTVVDDIVESGGEIVKEVKGGRSEFYTGHAGPVGPPDQAQNVQQPQTQSDASKAGV